MRKRKYKLLIVPPNTGGCAYYRSLLPGEKLKEHCSDKVDVRFDFNPLGMDEKTGQLSKSDDELESILWADIVLVNNISNFGGQYTARVVGKAKEAGKIVQYDTDDLLTELYDGHRLKSVYEEKGLSYIAGHLYSSSDLVTVTQAKFAHRIAPYIKGQLAVIKNSIDYNLPCWNAPKVPQPKRGKKRVVRVGWAGGIHHEQDVKQFAALPHLINGRVGKENVIWDFYGRPPKGQVKPGDFQEQVWPKYEAAFAKGFKGHRNYRIYDAMPTHEYGRMYANMDMAIAFLEDNSFNDSKSEIKVAECHKQGQGIFMSDGSIKNIEDIKINDFVMGPDSTPRKVLNTFSGENNFYKVTLTRTKEDLYLTKNHILCLKTNNKKYPRYLDIKISDYHNLSTREKAAYKLYKVPLEFSKTENLDLDPYFIGIMLGDGSMTKANVSITTEDDEIKDYFISYTTSLYNSIKIREYIIPNSKANSYHASKGDGFGSSVNPIAEDLSKIGLKGISCKNKFIPKEYLYSSRKNRLELLAGLIDTDGTLSKNNVFSISNTSDQLIKDIIFLARSLGFSTGVIQKQSKFTGNKEYICNRITITGNNIHKIPCKLKRKQAKKLIPKKDSLGRIKYKDNLQYGFTLENIGKDTYFGIEVDGDHKYVLDNFIVSHNCCAYNIPLIATDVGCYNETIKNGVTGYLLPKDNPKSEWIRVMTKVIRDHKHREELGKNLSKLYKDYFDINKVIHKRIELYDELFGKQLGVIE